MNEILKFKSSVAAEILRRVTAQLRNDEAETEDLALALELCHDEQDNEELLPLMADFFGACNECLGGELIAVLESQGQSKH